MKHQTSYHFYDANMLLCGVVSAGAVGANRWPERGRQAASGWDGAAWICGHQGRPACGSANGT
jgi:hypothetical protein